jgi:uncharacterized membrane protein YhaH (DUF805 family)
MDFVTAAKTCFAKYFDAKGRATRPEYWWFYLLYVIAYIVAALLASELVIIVYVAFLIPLIMAGIRRMHDTGRSGWFLLIPIANIVFLCSSGTPGDNKYGKASNVNLGALPPPPIA